MKKLQFWMNVVWVVTTLMAILYFLVDYRSFKHDVEREYIQAVKDNTDALNKNTDSWMKQAELNGKIIQYITHEN